MTTFFCSNPDSERPSLNPEDWTHEDVRRVCDTISDAINEWQGIPIPLGEDMPLVLNSHHQHRELYESMGETGGATVEIIVDDRYDEHGGPARGDDFDPINHIAERVANAFVCRTDQVRDDERIVNEWYSRKRQCRVLVYRRADKAFCVTIPVSPDRSMDRLTLWVRTIGASDAWELEAEAKAMEHLAEMVTPRQLRHYLLTGSFLEESPRSRLTYVFRRLRPTIALSERGKDGLADHMRCIAVLCLHPIGYYDKTWGGCLVPTDDVIAHLTHMRGDEAGFWKEANQHNPASPEAGL